MASATPNFPVDLDLIASRVYIHIDVYIPKFDRLVEQREKFLHIFTCFPPLFLTEIKIFPLKKKRKTKRWWMRIYYIIIKSIKKILFEEVIKIRDRIVAYDVCGFEDLIIEQNGTKS